MRQSQKRWKASFLFYVCPEKKKKGPRQTCALMRAAQFLLILPTPRGGSAIWWSERTLKYLQVFFFFRFVSISWPILPKTNFNWIKHFKSSDIWITSFSIDTGDSNDSSSLPRCPTINQERRKALILNFFMLLTLGPFLKGTSADNFPLGQKSF